MTEPLTLEQRLRDEAREIDAFGFNDGTTDLIREAADRIEADASTIASLRDANKALTAERDGIAIRAATIDEALTNAIHMRKAAEAKLAEARKALEFYADPLDFVTRNNLDEATPDFYDELDTGWRARSFLASKEASR